MLSKILVEIVDDYIKNEFVFSKFRQQILNGKFNLDQLKYYLNSVRYAIHHTPVLIALAAKSEFAKNNEKFRKILQHKDIEERGHETWARNDLVSLDAKEVIHSGQISPAAKDLVKELIWDVENISPLSILPYSFFGEYFIVQVGAELFEAFSKACHIPLEHLSVFTNHHELDQHHWKDSLAECEEMMSTPELQKLAIQVCNRTRLRYSEIFYDVAESARLFAAESKPVFGGLSVVPTADVGLS